MRAPALLAALALLTTAAAAPPPRSDPATEARAHALYRQIRCVVCQNESIDDSEADLAADLRALVRQEMAAGRTDREIKASLTDRYGEFVLLRPRLSLGNAVLWLAPLAIVIAGLAAFLLRARTRREVLDAELTGEERTRLAALDSPVTVPPQSGPTDTTAPV